MDKRRKIKFCIIDNSRISQVSQSKSNLYLDDSKFILYFSYTKGGLVTN